MQTTPDCLACLRRQANSTIDLVSPVPEIRQQARAEVEAYLLHLNPALSPPENATGLYALIARLTGCPDPFAAEKEAENRLGRQWQGMVRQHIAASDDPLLTGLKYAAAGNIIDHGANPGLDAQQALADCLARPLAINDLHLFREELAQAARILYLADNCGEIVFDGLLADLLATPGREVVFAVRGGAIINDATMADAHTCGLTKRFRVIGNGTACPGTPLSQCSDELHRYFEDADLIISKGQGNFETLTESGAPLYFLLTVKCGVVADCLTSRTGIRPEIGQLVLHRGRGSLPLR